MSIHFDTKHIAEVIADKRRGSHIQKKPVANPEIVWLIACISFLTFFLISVGVSVWWYQHIRTLSVNVETNYQSTIPHYSAILVDEVHTDFEKRRERFDTLFSQSIVETEEVMLQADEEGDMREEMVDINSSESLDEEVIETQDENGVEEMLPDMTGVSPEF